MAEEKKSIKQRFSDTLKFLNDTEAVDKKIESILPTGDDAKRNNLWIGACAATVASGLFTYFINWNPAVRAFAHLAGAFAIPAGGALASSLVMNGIEKAVNLGINSYNKNHPENEKEAFEINPKAKEVIKFLSTAVVGVAYTYGTLGTEIVQYQNSGILQIGQYSADVLGSLAGIVAFNKMDFNDTLASFANVFWIGGKAISKPMNAIEDMLKGKSKNTPEKTSSLQVEEINVDLEEKKQDNNTHAWDLDLYQDQPVSHTQQSNSQVVASPSSPTQNPNLSSNELDVEDEINM